MIGGQSGFEFHQRLFQASEHLTTLVISHGEILELAFPQILLLGCNCKVMLRLPDFSQRSVDSFKIDVDVPLTTTYDLLLIISAYVANATANPTNHA